MNAYIRTSGDRSVGVFPHEIVVSGLHIDPADRETDRIQLAEMFTDYFGENVSVQFDGECADCGKADGTHLDLCPNKPGSDL